MIFLIKHIIAIVLTVLFSCTYGYICSGTEDNTLTAVSTLAYSASLVALYIYCYDTQTNKIKYFGVFYTFCQSLLGFYIAWVVWIIIRSDYQLFLFETPAQIWSNISSMSDNLNVKLVHSRYAGVDNSGTLLYCFWAAELACTVCFPTFFAAQAITSYSDDNLPVENLHREFDKPGINQIID